MEGTKSVILLQLLKTRGRVGWVSVADTHTPTISSHLAGREKGGGVQDESGGEQGELIEQVLLYVLMAVCQASLECTWMLSG